VRCTRGGTFLRSSKRRHQHDRLRLNAPELGAVLTPLKVRPESLGARGDVGATAVLDRRCARRPIRRGAGTKERALQGPNKGTGLKRRTACRQII
jgi:hypothetical protein